MATFSSAKYTNIARPYAAAAFDYAREKQQLGAWKAFLESAASIAEDPSVQVLLANPEITGTELFDLFRDILSNIHEVNAERKNFLLLLAQNKRLILLPEISSLFNAYSAALEKISNVRVITAIDLKDDYKQKLAHALSERMKHDVKLHCEIDPSIIGGAIIHIGDRVIDGSVRGDLTRLLNFL